MSHQHQFDDAHDSSLYTFCHLDSKTCQDLTPVTYRATWNLVNAHSFNYCNCFQSQTSPSATVILSQHTLNKQTGEHWMTSSVCVVYWLTLPSSRSMLSRLLLLWMRPLILRSDGLPWLTVAAGGAAAEAVGASEPGGTLQWKDINT